MRTFFLAVLFASCGALAAADLRIDPGASVRDGTLNVSPTVQGPAGASLRYEIKTTRQGVSGSSSSSQSGNVRLGEDGRGKLATTNISVGRQDRYRMGVRLLQDGRVVAEREVRYPD